jgi:threonine/homoserine/homoserine lactone efflux protein
MFFFTYLRRELRRRLRQAVVTALGLALGIGLVVTVTALSSGVRADHPAAAGPGPCQGRMREPDPCTT